LPGGGQLLTKGVQLSDMFAVARLAFLLILITQGFNPLLSLRESGFQMLPLTPLLFEFALLGLQPLFESSATCIALCPKLFQLPAGRFGIGPRRAQPGSGGIALTGQGAGPLAEFVIVMTHRQQVALQFLDLMRPARPQNNHFIVYVLIFDKEMLIAH
jgi:hypothetical protein